MKRLLRLYPRAWRRRYQAEMEALLEELPASPGVWLDLLRGALDARLEGRPSGPWRRAAGATALAVIGTLLLPRAGEVGPLMVAGVLTAASLGCRLLGWRLPAWYCGLLALRAADGWLHTMVAPPVAPVLAVAGACLWTVATALLLLRAGLNWPLAAVVTAVLAVAGPSLLAPDHLWTVLRATASPRPLAWPAPAATLETLRYTLWAAVLAALVTARRPRWGPFRDWPGGLGVPARPRPGSPLPMLAAAVRRRREEEAATAAGSGRR